MKSARHDDDSPIIELVDGALAVTEAVHIAMARVMPPAMADQIASHLGRFASTIRPSKRRTLEELYRTIVGDTAGMPRAEDYVPTLIGTLLQQRMIYARLGANADWQPREFVIEGADAIAAERAKGRAVVLWLLPTEMIAHLVRMACRHNGWPLPFLSHWQHGLSRSTIGRATINARDCRIDALFGPRMVMEQNDTRTALASAQAILNDGGMVGFRGIGWSKRPVSFPLFEGWMHLAFGAPVTARRTGASLFVASAGRTEIGFRVRFEQIEGHAERPLEELGAEFAAKLEATAKASPSLWSVKSRQWQANAPDADEAGSPAS